jgi:hypothetical protein
MTLNYMLEFESDAQTTGKFCYRFCTVIAQKIDSESPAHSPSGFPSMSSAPAISVLSQSATIAV